VEAPARELAVVRVNGVTMGLIAPSLLYTADGARLVARCWVDPAFEARMLESVNVAAKECRTSVPRYSRPT
jgi:hypothetical protein